MLGPIFQREVLTVPRRSRHYGVRSLYISVLLILGVTAWQAAFGWGRQSSLGDIAFFGTLLFQLFSFLQLALVVFFSALFAASAITQEKDRGTFILLLITDLHNHEIVLGKLFGSLLQIGTLLVCALPVLVFTVLLGGVSLGQVLLAFLVLVSSALVAGSLGCLLALWREKTFQTLAFTVLFLVLYVCVVEALPLAVPAIGVSADIVEGWQMRLSPYRAMQSVMEPATPPVSPPSEGGDGGGVSRLAALVQTRVVHFSAAMVLLTGLLNAWGIWKLRVWNPSGEPIQQREAPGEDVEAQAKERRADVHAAPGKLRAVWANPVLWREIRTRAYGHRAMLIKLGYLLVFAMICFWVYGGLPHASPRDRLLPAWGLVPVVVLSMLLLNAQAVTAITSERDGKALELLLVSDLTPMEFIFGKLGGILYNTKEIVLPPLLLAVAYAWWGFIGLETLIYVLIALVVLLAFTVTLGLHVSLRLANTRVAIGYSLGTIFFLFVGTLVCIYMIAISNQFENQWTIFIAFSLVGVGGMLLVLVGTQPSTALTVAAWGCPFGMFYTIISIIIGNPFTREAGDPLWPFLVITFAFGFTVAAMLVPLLSEFHVALSYTTPAEE